MPETSLRVAFAVPGDLATPTGGYAYARELLAQWPDLAVTATLVALPGGFPAPSADDLAASARLLGAVPADHVLLIDGLAYGVLPAGLIAGISAPIVALVHHPLGLETGLLASRRDALLASEAAALALARHVVATSAATARSLARDFGVPALAITVAEPGTRQAPRARGTGAPVTLLAVGAVSPRKGYDLLVRALVPLAGLDWRLTVVGALDRDPGTALALKMLIAETGLATRINLVGGIDDEALAQAYDCADILVSASLYEGYGMVLAEGLARGLPLVASTGGAAAETVPDGTGLKVSEGDVGALSDALRRMIGEPHLRRASAEAAWAAGRALPTWRDTAAKVTAALRAAR